MELIHINQNDSGQRVDKFLQKHLKSAPMGLIYKYIRTNKVKVNGKKPDIAYRLQPGDEVRLYIVQTFEKQAYKPVFCDLDIAYEDAHLLVVNKPAEMACQSDKTHAVALVDYIKGYLYRTGQYRPEKEHSFAPALCNRLDVNTTGLVIAAKDAESLRILNEKIRLREVKKYYLCRLSARPKQPEGLLGGYIVKDRQANRSTIVRTPVPGALAVQTRYRMLEGDVAEVELLTGRSHQIRAHMASIGCPLLGDEKYGGTKIRQGHQLLCAYKLTFDFTPGTALDYLNGKCIEIRPEW